MGRLCSGGRSAVGFCQQGVETVVSAGVISFVAAFAVVDGRACEGGLIHKHGAVTGQVSGLGRFLEERGRRNQEYSEHTFRRRASFLKE